VAYELGPSLLYVVFISYKLGPILYGGRLITKKNKIIYGQTVLYLDLLTGKLNFIKFKSSRR